MLGTVPSTPSRSRRIVPAEPSAEGAGPPSFAEFFEGSHRDLFRALYLLTGSAAEADELLQEAFVRVLERWDRVSRMDRPTGYLYRCAMNLHRNRRRRARLVWHPMASDVDGTDQFARADERDALARGLAVLPPRQRAAVILTELLDYTSEQAGEVLGVKAASVRALAHQGRRALREALGGRDG
ncbi:MAG TPA: sigma-70 family RNA polymerase sigma factor [Actinomycetota bacterium]